ncbi:MAG: glycosyltransferase family 9 protein [Candidatus Magnetoovum sp. WYHC-5]|nr:glycosyltransferase family 9 protein [Candidatus Magnetoovum sp. WYHC-5]
MNIKKMRKIDKYVGAFICICLEIYNRFKKIISFIPSHSDKHIKNILITKYLGMGSILLATPMLRSLRHRFPQSRISLITFTNNADFARQLTIFDEVIGFRTSNLFLLALDVVQTLIKIRRHRYDVVFDLEFFARFSTIISYLSGAPMRVGYYLPSMWRGDLLTHHIHFNPHKHVTEIFSAQLAVFGITVTDFKLTPPIVHGTAMATLMAKLQRSGLTDKQHVVSINVNASDLCEERKWPIERFAGLIDYIVNKRQDVKIVLVGSKGERDYVSNIFNTLSTKVNNNVVNFSGILSMDEFISLLKISYLFITNDSGPLHIASALGITTLSFFGPETPTLYGPVGSKNVIFYSDIYCSPCLNVYNAKTAMCDGNNVCMQEIHLSHVIATLEEKKLL